MIVPTGLEASMGEKPRCFLSILKLYVKIGANSDGRANQMEHERKRSKKMGLHEQEERKTIQIHDYLYPFGGW